MRNVRKKGNMVYWFTSDGDHLAFSLGNTKLSSRVLIFNLPAGETCPQVCPNCYAMKSQKRYPAVLRCRRNNLETLKKHSPNILSAAVYDILTYLKSQNIPMKCIRIHESGDFYSDEYFQAWKHAAKIVYPLGIRVYTYTKREYRKEDTDNYINIVESILPDGSLNYGSHDYITEKMRRYHGVICPYGYEKNVVCGETCRLCWNHKRVLFLEH